MKYFSYIRHIFYYLLPVIACAQEGYGVKFSDKNRVPENRSALEISGKHPACQRLNAPINLPFINTNNDAGLYYCTQTGELVAVTYYTPDNRVIKIKRYPLLMPVSILQQYHQNRPWWLIPNSMRFTGAILLLLLAGLYLLRRRKIIASPLADTIPPIPTVQEPLITQAVTPAPIAVHNIAINTPAPAATIHLFGPFTILDNTGKDITRLFSPLVKELFLLLLLPNITGHAGITSERLSEILWPNMTPAAAKNNRSVNIAKLRGILEKIGNCSLIKEKGRWQLLFDADSIQIDVQAWQQLPPLDQNNSAHIRFLQRGLFLEGMEYSWLDNYKQEINQQVITQLDAYLHLHAAAALPSTVIDICNCLLHFDALSEEAVLYKCRALVQLHQHASARKLYQHFQEEYQAIYGEKFEREYTQALTGEI